MFITFEGGEGAGKTTLIHALRQYLFDQNRQFPLCTKEPGSSFFGAFVRETLLNGANISPAAEMFLFLADRAQHVQDVIRPALSNKTIVLCDRFVDSTFAYQGAARKGKEDLIRSACHYATGGLVPDKTFLLDIDPALGLARASRATKRLDRIEEEKLDFHKRVREAYLRMARDEPERVIVLDAGRSTKELLQDVIKTCPQLITRQSDSTFLK